MSYSRPVTSPSAQSLFDAWIRGRFAELNTALERRYAAAGEGETPATGELKRTLLKEGKSHIGAVLGTDFLDGAFDQLFAQLGNVGLYMAACTRHGLNEPVGGRSPLEAASRLAAELGQSLDVAPRFLAAHLSLLNPTHSGRPKLFTHLDAERTFIEYNTRGMVAFQMTSQALKALLGVGITSRWAPAFLDQARDNLQIALQANRSLMEELEVQPFFQGVRPYYKPHHVGDRICRGANAGDFAAINEVDLILGLCSAEDPFYRAVLDEKRVYLIPEDRAALDRTRLRHSLLDEFLAAATEFQSTSRPDWWEETVPRFLEVCRLHGAISSLHHNGLVDRFIAKPAAQLPPQALEDLTASGPPLSEVIHQLERLKDLRRAASREGIHSRHRDLESLRGGLQKG